MFMSPTLPDSINLDGMLDFMINATNDEPETHDHDVPGFPRLPEELMRLFRFLPRHSDLPYEPTILRDQEKHLIRNIIGQLLKDIPQHDLRDLYSELAQSDRDNLGSIPYKSLKQALDRRRVSDHLTLSDTCI